MRQKRLMLLGGIRYLLPVIEAAHQQGYYVITADYLPNNIAHKFSDEYANVSIINREAVLKVAAEKKIDGIMSFGVDPGVITAAYVQEKLGLPSFGPFESVEILQNKDRFRSFLSENGFSTPRAKGYSSLNDVVKDADIWHYPIMIKPSDSAGSKGVSKVETASQVLEAAKNAIAHSYCGRIIVEEFIEKQGCSSDSDCFLDNGYLSFVSFSSQFFDNNAANPFTPAAYSWPSYLSSEQIRILSKEIQRLLSLLQMRTGIYNVETRIGTDGTPYLMEVTPRGGGNRLSEMIKFCTDVDLITACVRDCVGDSYKRVIQQPIKGFWSESIIHSNQGGYFAGIDLKDTIIPHVVEIDIWVKRGDVVHSFNGANDAIGTIILRFEDQNEFDAFINSQQDWYKINLI